MAFCFLPVYHASLGCGSPAPSGSADLPSMVRCGTPGRVFFPGIRDTDAPEDLFSLVETKRRNPGGSSEESWHMEPQKMEMLRKLDEKGMTVTEAAEAIGFDPLLLGLYLVSDGYPVPRRILDKLAAVVNS